MRYIPENCQKTKIHLGEVSAFLEAWKNMEPGGSSFFRKMGTVVQRYKIKPLSKKPCRPDADCYGCSKILYDRMKMLALELVPSRYLEISSNMTLPLADIVKAQASAFSCEGCLCAMVVC